MVVLVTARRRARKPCKTSGKVPYRDQAAAKWGTARIYAKTGRPDPLYVYQCPDCTWWHTTSSAGGTSIPVPIPEGALTKHRDYVQAQAARRRQARRVLDEPA